VRNWRVQEEATNSSALAKPHSKELIGASGICSPSIYSGELRALSSRLVDFECTFVFLLFVRGPEWAAF